MASQKSYEVSIPSVEQVEKERKTLQYRQNYRNTFFSTIGIIIIVAAIAVLIASSVLPVLKVSGTTMQPTLEGQDIVVVWKTDQLDSGDVVSFYYRNNLQLRRVIATSGDIVEMDENGNVYVNDQLLEEPYLTEKALGQCDLEFPYQVPENHVFVLGDNRAEAIDSRNINLGSISKDQILGKVVLRVWPFQHVGFVK